MAAPPGNLVSRYRMALRTGEHAGLWRALNASDASIARPLALLLRPSRALRSACRLDSPASTPFVNS
jgi:hypothetical protein